MLAKCFRNALEIYSQHLIPAYPWRVYGLPGHRSAHHEGNLLNNLESASHLSRLRLAAGAQVSSGRRRIRPNGYYHHVEGKNLYIFPEFVAPDDGNWHVKIAIEIFSADAFFELWRLINDVMPDIFSIILFWTDLFYISLSHRSVRLISAASETSVCDTFLTQHNGKAPENVT